MDIDNLVDTYIATLGLKRLKGSSASPILPFFIATTFCCLAWEGSITKQLPIFLLVIIIVLLMKKRKPADGDEVPRSGPSRGIPIRVEVLSGLCYNADLHFHLRRNLTIGCDSGCDLVFEDARMLPMHAVISRASGVVTIAECADTGNTYVGGMKIFAPNRLRSGDIVTVGSTTFRVFFEK